ncbi:MAG: phospholipase D-like domain-containing protein [Cellulomonas sp.]|nr:phospholipase D-like domain-containing protein [Cellulomonas sp.]
MRHPLAMTALTVALLAAAVTGCSASSSTSSATPTASATSTSSTSQAPTLSLVVEPDAGYQPVYDFIAGARVSLDMTMYQLQDTAAQDALKAAAARGVTVRVLLDSDIQDGGSPTMNQAAYADLSAHGVEVRWAWSGTLWHQKSLSRDGVEALVMTCNLYQPYYSAVRDFVVRTDNRATVAGMDATFDTDWAATDVAPTVGVIPEGSDLVWSPGAQEPLVALIDSARRGSTIWAEDEQLDSPAIQDALVSAAGRGVTVNFLMTTDPDWAAGLTALSQGGVNVRVYQPNAVIYIHAKVLTVDDEAAYVGSANFTTAMTDQNRNVGIITTDPGVVSGISSTIESDFAGAAPYVPGS